MRKKTTIFNPAGTIIALFLAFLLTGFVLFAIGDTTHWDGNLPLKLISAILFVFFFIVFQILAIQGASEHMDKIDNGDADKIAKEWNKNKYSNESGVSVSNTVWTDAPISLPISKKYIYYDDTTDIKKEKP